MLPLFVMWVCLHLVVLLWRPCWFFPRSPIHGGRPRGFESSVFDGDGEVSLGMWSPWVPCSGTPRHRFRRWPWPSTRSPPLRGLRLRWRACHGRWTS